ncbi:MAG: integrase arm-type DNA-binding domain-containing protein [Azoarcus sp.]|jgi:integrase|nr:integrase arm-type DNA-binding domain-containing protein [Azoarcus sp.]
MALSDIEIRKASLTGKSYKMVDGGGLYVIVTATGGKWWRLDYRFGGKRKTLALGTYPEISLADARQRRNEARKLLANGTDPGEMKKAQKAAKLKPAEVVNTFQQVAEDWREVWKTHVTPATNKEIWANLTTYVFPRIGALPIADVSTKVLIDCLRQIEETGRGATLRKSKGAVSLIFKFAIQNERGVTQNPVLNFDRHTFRKFKVRNFPTLLDPLEIGKLLRAIDAYHGTLPSVSAALRLAPMLFQRIGELRTMRWADVDLDNPDGAEWNYIVGKTQAPHNVPLSRQAVTILRELHPITWTSEFVFPSFRAGRPMSEAAINTALETMGYNTREQITGHGFRAMAYTHLRERLKFPKELVDFQLAHRHSEDRYDGAYARMTFRDERKEMMQSWADYLDKLKTGANVIPLYGGQAA